MSDTTGQPKRLSDGEIIELIRALKDLLPDAGWLSTMGQRAVQNMVAAEIDLDNTRAELADMRRVVAEAVAALKQCNYAVSGLPGCITDALHRVPLTYEDERSVGERETYDAIRALVATASTEQESRR
jgi:hypothetical protein